MDRRSWGAAATQCMGNPISTKPITIAVINVKTRSAAFTREGNMDTNLPWLKTAWWIGAALMLLMLASAAQGVWAVPLYATSLAAWLKVPPLWR